MEVKADTSAINRSGLRLLGLPVIPALIPLFVQIPPFGFNVHLSCRTDWFPVTPNRLPTATRMSPLTLSLARIS